MKTIRILLSTLLLALSLGASAQIAVLEKYADAKGVTYVHLSESMLKMAGKYAIEEVGDVKIGGMIGKMTCLQTIKTHNAATAEALLRDIRKAMGAADYPLLMELGKSIPAKRTQIFSKQTTGRAGKTSVVIISRNGAQTTVVGMEGRFTSDDIAKLMKN